MHTDLSHTHTHTHTRVCVLVQDDEGQDGDHDDDWSGPKTIVKPTDQLELTEQVL